MEKPKMKIVVMGRNGVGVTTNGDVTKVDYDAIRNKRNLELKTINKGVVDVPEELPKREVIKRKF